MIYALLAGVAVYFLIQGFPMATTVADTKTGPGGMKYHIVKGGDWMSKIAPKYGLSMPQLLELNPQFQPGGGRNPATIHPGEKIRVK